MAKDMKHWLKLLLLGTGVVILTPLVDGFIPDIFALGTFITLGTALSAGVAAFVTQWLLDMWK